MSMWSSFDEKIKSLSDKASELEEHKVKLTGVPARLLKIRTNFDTIISQKISQRDETFKKDLETKVGELNSVLEKLSKTKTESDPVFTELESALSGLEKFTGDSSSSTPESGPEKVQTVGPTSTPVIGNKLNPKASPFVPQNKKTLNPNAAPFVPKSNKTLTGTEVLMPTTGGYISSRKYSRKHKKQGRKTHGKPKRGGKSMKKSKAKKSRKMRKRR